MEVPLDVRTVRRRYVCPDLLDLPDFAGDSGYDNGIFARPRRTGKPGAHVPKAGEKRHEMAYSRLCGADRQHMPHGVLYGCVRLDDLLFCKVFDGDER